MRQSIFRTIMGQYVRDLLTDQRSIAALEVLGRWTEGDATKDELKGAIKEVSEAQLYGDS